MMNSRLCISLPVDERSHHNVCILQSLTPAFSPFSDVSGMEEAHCDRTEFLSNYLTTVDDIILVPGSLGRIRSRYPSNPKCEPKENTIFLWFSSLNFKGIKCTKQELPYITDNLREFSIVVFCINILLRNYLMFLKLYLCTTCGKEKNNFRILPWVQMHLYNELVMYKTNELTNWTYVHVEMAMKALNCIDYYCWICCCISDYMTHKD